MLLLCLIISRLIIYPTSNKLLWYSRPYLTWPQLMTLHCFSCCLSTNSISVDLLYLLLCALSLKWGSQNSNIGATWELDKSRISGATQLRWRKICVLMSAQVISEHIPLRSLAQNILATFLPLCLFLYCFLCLECHPFCPSLRWNFFIFWGLVQLNFPFLP